MPDLIQTYSQHRRWLKTRFTFEPKKLAYSVTSKQEVKLEEEIGWDAIGAPSSYVATVEPDREMRWVFFVMSGLAVFAALRANVHPLLLMGLYGGVTAVAVAIFALTRRLRSVGYTAVPAGTLNVLVLDDSQHDTILAGLEARRAASLLRSVATARGLTRRVYLRRLRWLVDNGAMTREAFRERQNAVLPNETLLREGPPPAPPMSFTQRTLTTRIVVTLETSRLIYGRRTLLDGAERFEIDYRDLRGHGHYEETDKQLWLTAILIAWIGAALLSWGAWINTSHPAGYYVGGVGLGRAITDFGPMLLLCIATAAFVPMLTQLRIARPWAGVLLLRDRQYRTLVAEIEGRRVAALRSLAAPDPLLHPEEQVQMLDELLEGGILSEEEHTRAVERAELALGDSDLDEPVMPNSKPERDRVLH